MDDEGPVRRVVARAAHAATTATTARMPNAQMAMPSAGRDLTFMTVLLTARVSHLPVTSNPDCLGRLV